MSRVGEMAVALLRRIADGQPHQLEKLEGVVAKSPSQVPRDPDVRANDGPATDAKREISRAREPLAQEGPVSRPRRGVVGITTKGPEEIARRPERPALPNDSVQSKPRAESAARLAGADESEAAPARSPPLSPGEIADIKAIASGAARLRRVSKSELYRIVSADAVSEARAGRLAPSSSTGRHDVS